MATRIDESAFAQAATDMAALKVKNDVLKNKLETLFDNLTEALDTPAGHAIEFTGKDVVVQPIEDMAKVIGLMTNILNAIIGRGSDGSGTYFDKLFEEYNTIDAVLKQKKKSI